MRLRPLSIKTAGKACHTAFETGSSSTSPIVHRQRPHKCAHQIKALESCKRARQYHCATYQPEIEVEKKGRGDERDERRGEDDRYRPEEDKTDRKPCRSTRAQYYKDDRHDVYLAMTEALRSRPARDSRAARASFLGRWFAHARRAAPRYDCIRTAPRPPIGLCRSISVAERTDQYALCRRRASASHIRGRFIISICRKQLSTDRWMRLSILIDINAAST
jgi:hypothetical protein